MNKQSTYSKFAKRPIDLAAGLTLLILTSPIMLIVGCAIRLTMGSPVIFRQRRIGLGDREFSIYKFRTMRNAENTDRVILSNQGRTTPLGRVLRAFSLDELPQFWNVIRGDMSFVGPRPLYVEYLPYYTSRERLRHTVRPGITGLAQVSGRNMLCWDDRLELDVQYVEHLTFSNDLSVAVRTVLKVVKRSDIAVVPGLLQGPLNVVRKNHKRNAEEVTK